MKIINTWLRGGERVAESNYRNDLGFFEIPNTASGVSIVGDEFVDFLGAVSSVYDDTTLEQCRFAINRMLFEHGSFNVVRLAIGSPRTEECSKDKRTHHQRRAFQKQPTASLPHNVGLNEMCQ